MGCGNNWKLREEVLWIKILVPVVGGWIFHGYIYTSRKGPGRLNSRTRRRSTACELMLTFPRTSSAVLFKKRLLHVACLFESNFNVTLEPVIKY